VFQRARGTSTSRYAVRRPPPSRQRRFMMRLRRTQERSRRHAVPKRRQPNQSRSAGVMRGASESTRGFNCHLSNPLHQCPMPLSPPGRGEGPDEAAPVKASAVSAPAARPLYVRPRQMRADEGDHRRVAERTKRKLSGIRRMSYAAGLSCRRNDPRSTRLGPREARDLGPCDRPRRPHKDGRSMNIGTATCRTTREKPCNR
jgi:hypothetical protein